jgi:hypothetical protein
LRTTSFDIALAQRAMVARNGRMAMRYAIPTISNNPNIVRMAMRFGARSLYEQGRHKRNYGQDFFINPIEPRFAPWYPCQSIGDVSRLILSDLFDLQSGRM